MSIESSYTICPMDGQKCYMKNCGKFDQSFMQLTFPIVTCLEMEKNAIIMIDRMYGRVYGIDWGIGPDTVYTVEFPLKIQYIHPKYFKFIKNL